MTDPAGSHPAPTGSAGSHPGPAGAAHPAPTGTAGSHPDSAGSAGAHPDPVAPARPELSFREAGGERPVQAVPLSHVSIEVGHLYREDLVAGPDRLRHHFGQVAPWVEAVRRIGDAELSPRRPRVSTCFLLDDYSTRLDLAGELVPELVRSAQECGVGIDYLAREAGCVEANGVPLARLVEDRLVADPPPGCNGARPPVTETGWLCNGSRSPVTVGAAAAMEPTTRWAPPAENAANRHSIFVDVELWDDEDTDGRTWSCAFLAAVWQLLRLGLLRWQGGRVTDPRPWDEVRAAADWSRMPAVVQVNPQAAPFSAYRTCSVLPGGFLPTEHAVRTILGQVAVEPEVLAQVADRAGGEGVALPAEPVDRIAYVFTG